MSRKVLIVDDNKINRKMLLKILENDYDVFEAEDGIDALEILAADSTGFSAVLLDLQMPRLDGYSVLEKMHQDPMMSVIPVIITTGNTDFSSEIQALSLGANDYITKPYNPEIIRHRLWNTINLRETAAMVNALKRDDLTGLYNRKAFFEAADKMIKDKPSGYYVMTCFDIDGFKIINDQYGNAKGDEVLRFIADVFKSYFHKMGGICCRMMADTFAVLYPEKYMNSKEISDMHCEISEYSGILMPLSFSIGRYVADDLSVPVNGMYDRATMAQESIKSQYDIHVAMYDESMREHLVEVRTITGEMSSALENRQFEVWFQPQYNHETGALIGSEALVRWRHPKKGLIPPGKFIPVFEQNGFIYELDRYVWEQSCVLLRKWIDDYGIQLPVSVNVSRHDVFRNDIVNAIEEIVDRYEIPHELLRIEITESAFEESSDRIINVVKQLVDCGFTVEIDDFGSGYSSLNTLKDVPADILKLDMRFLEGEGNLTRGGSILESMVRMAKWLQMSVIAEGVEKQEQADYLKSIGCKYIQGYFYARPIPADDYEKLLVNSKTENQKADYDIVETYNNNSFWDPMSLDTLIFNSYVGGASVFEYRNGQVEMLKANDKFAKVLGGEDFTVSDALKIVWSEHADKKELAKMTEAVELAIKTNDEASCDIKYKNLIGKNNITFIHSTVRIIAKTGNMYLVYCVIENQTTQHIAEQKAHTASLHLQTVLDSINCGVLALSISNDEPYTVIFANELYYGILGYTKEQFNAEVGSANDIVIPHDREAADKAIKNLIATRKETSFCYHCKKRDGTTTFLKCDASVLRLDDVNSDVLLSIVTEIK